MSRHRLGAFITLFALIVTLGTTVAMKAASADARSSRRRAAALRMEERRASDPLRVTQHLAEIRLPWPASATLEENLASIDHWLATAAPLITRARAALDALIDAASHSPAYRRPSTNDCTRNSRRSSEAETRCSNDVLSYARPGHCGTLPTGTRAYRRIRRARLSAGAQPDPSASTSTTIGNTDDRSKRSELRRSATGRIPRRVDREGRDVALGEPGHAISRTIRP
ncbi:MAG: hypothetical protein H6834_05595 [Planctomycetes bacterium]|nr:hypothetical protein [Planctomycetota bacterium]